MTGDPGLLPHAPINEAVLDIWVGSTQGSVEQLRTVGPRLGSEFQGPEARTMFEGHFNMSSTDGQSASTRVQELGSLFRTAEGDIVQFRKDGYSANRLRPYVSWAAFRSLARNHWQTYLDVARPDSVRRVGLRYINEFSIPVAPPFEEADLRRFFTWTLSLPDEFGQPAGLFSRVSLEPAEGQTATLTFLTKPASDSEETGFILDIEVQQSGPWEPRDEAIWEALDQQRALKNALFSGSITSELRGRFE